MDDHAGSVAHGRRRFRNRWAIGAIGGAVALVGGLALCVTIGSDADSGPQWETALVTRGPVRSLVIATGTVSPVVTVQVGSQVSGRIQELLVDFNSPVEKGQVIARIDPRLFDSEVARSQANLSAARAAVQRAKAERDNAQLSHERMTHLAAKKLVAQAEADTARATFQAAEAQLSAALATLDQSKASLDQAKTNLAFTTIVSPIDGIVISRDVDVGQTVAASLQAPTLFTIAEDLRKMEVHTSVAESDVGRLRAGMVVEFTVDAYLDEKFAGVVKQVRFSPETVQNVVTYDAVVSVDNAYMKLRPGMTADVAFVVAKKPNALLVPNGAMRFRLPGADRRWDSVHPGPTRLALPSGSRRERGPAEKTKGARRAHSDPRGLANGPDTVDGGGPLADPARWREIWTLGSDERPVPARVEVGISDGVHTEIIGGDLSAGDQVIVGRKSHAAQNSKKRRSRFGRFL